VQHALAQPHVSQHIGSCVNEANEEMHTACRGINFKAHMGSYMD
jgi:hypothetical protein